MNRILNFYEEDQIKTKKLQKIVKLNKNYSNVLPQQPINNKQEIRELVPLSKLLFDCTKDNCQNHTNYKKKNN